MGLIDDELKQLKDLVSSLESRIQKLESPGSGPSSTEQLRMILIGPPGAGTQPFAAFTQGLSILAHLNC